MRIATKKDKPLVEHIISEAFVDNPNINFMIRTSSNKEKKIKQVANYAFDFALNHDGVYLTDDSEGLVICYQQPAKPVFKDYLNQLKMIVQTLDLKKLFSIMRRDAYIKSIRPQHEKALYVWFFAVSNKARGNGAAVEIKNFLFDKAAQLQLPIYAETTLRQNKIVYERYGFETYHFWENEPNGIKTWFMRKKVSVKKEALVPA